MLRLTKMADYGFVLLIRMAAGRLATPHNARDLARQSNLPLPMVSKVLKSLVRNGLLVSHRGTKGGYMLAREPQQITAAEIITALDGPISVTECLDVGDSQCNYELRCPVKQSWNQINLAIRDALAGVTLAEMASPDCCKTPWPFASNGEQSDKAPWSEVEVAKQ